MSNKIGIFLPGGNGDIMTAMSVLKYKDYLWPNKEIYWFCSPIESDVLKFAPVEIKIWEDFTQLIINKDKDNGLHSELKKQFSSLDEIEIGYFPAPWMYSAEDPERKDKNYPDVSKNIFKIPSDWEWHPMLYFSNEEREMVENFCLSLPHKKTIMLETGSRSKQSAWNANMTRETMRICRKMLGPCNFIFASKGDNSEFFDDKDHISFVDDSGVVSCSHFTVRQTALVNNYSNLFIGISSGISVATSCWDNKPTPKLQYANTLSCSTVPIANGPIEFVEIHALKNPEEVYYQKLSNLLKSGI